VVMNIGVVLPYVVWIVSTRTLHVDRNGKLIKIIVIGELSYRRIHHWQDGKRSTKPDRHGKDDDDDEDSDEVVE